MTGDEPTTTERRWFSRLRRVLRDMPETVELQVHHSTLQMNRAGARIAAADAVGHSDDVECLEWTQTKRVYPCSESI